MSTVETWWFTGVEWAIWGIAMALIMAWISRSRMRKSPDSGARLLAHSRSTLVVGLVCFLFFASIAVISNVMPNESTTWWTTAVFVGFAALAIPIIADYLRARHEVSETGMSYGKLFGSRGHFSWIELRNVSYAPAWKWFRLETRHGEVARISVMLTGLPEFARLLIANAPHGVIEQPALSVLRETAAGQPPSLWR
jgi:hypothetical protein